MPPATIRMGSWWRACSPCINSSPRPARLTRRRPQQCIEATDGQIDSLAYELYGLTEEEIGIVEAASR